MDSEWVGVNYGQSGVTRYRKFYPEKGFGKIWMLEDGGPGYELSAYLYHSEGYGDVTPLLENAETRTLKQAKRELDDFFDQIEEE